uniref:Uncharacterized protein n=1 Tax=Mola mola TaxID=94237 RepID=A0A3Q3VTN3_MOLML
MITTGVELPEGNIAIVQDSYKYLWIPKANGNHEEATRKSASAKYLRRVRLVLKSQLNGHVWCILTWPKEEIEAGGEGRDSSKAAEKRKHRFESMQAQKQNDKETHSIMVYALKRQGRTLYGFGG